MPDRTKTIEISGVSYVVRAASVVDGGVRLMLLQDADGWLNDLMQKQGVERYGDLPVRDQAVHLVKLFFIPAICAVVSIDGHDLSPEHVMAMCEQDVYYLAEEVVGLNPSWRPAPGSPAARAVKDTTPPFPEEPPSEPSEEPT